MTRRSLTSLTSSISSERLAGSSCLYGEDCMITDYRTHRLDAPVDFPENVGAEIIWKISDRGGYMKKFAWLIAACLLAAAWAQESKPAAKPAAGGAKYWNTDQGKWSENPAVPGAHFMVVSGDP